MVSIAPANGKAKIKYKNGNTTDIVNEVISCYKDSNQQVKQFAPQLQGATLLQTCNNIWNFIKYNITYKIDPAGVQWIKTPARLWNDKQGDCKSFSVMAASLLTQLGITPTLRFTSYNLDETPTHVYVVVLQGNKEIIIDAVYNAFNQQKQFNYKQDYTMAQISRLSGIDNENTKQAISSPTSRKLAYQLDQLLAERENERKAGTYTPQRAALYNKWIAKTKTALNKAAGVDITSTVNGGLFGGLLGINSKLEKEFVAAAPAIAPAFLYLYLVPAGYGNDRFFNTQNSYVLSQAQMTPQMTALVGATGVGKRSNAVNCFIHLGGQIDDGKAESLILPTLTLELTKQLGMTPKEFWRRWFEGKDAQVGIIPVAAGVALFQGAKGILDKLKGLFSGLLPTLEFTPALDTFAPSMSDWAGTPYPIDKTLLVANSGGTGNPTGGGNGGNGTVDDLQNKQDKNIGLGLALAGAAFTFLK